LNRETKLLSDLRQVLKDQREAVATEDLSRVDDTIFAAQRIFRTLAEARTKRRNLLEILAGDPDTPLTEIETSLGPRATPAVAEALKELHCTAADLSGDLEMNREVLQGAIRSGEELIRALTGAGNEDAGTYGPVSGPKKKSSGDHGLIINRQV
jgi:hypothetical protein